MAVFINGTGCISPQNTCGDEAPLHKFISPIELRFTCKEPEYHEYIDAKAIRRMSRIIKMGMTSAYLALEDANKGKPDAVIIGTAWGCLEDTLSFLNKMVINQEEMLNPTAFIHSTHNTIASQIALNLKTTGYNSTYVHRNLSFESALLDAILLLNEKSHENILVGGIDELTEESYVILQRLGYYSESNSDKARGKTEGIVAGEGSSFFQLSGEKSSYTQAELTELKTLSFTSREEVEEAFKSIKSLHNLGEPVLILSGATNLNHEENEYHDIYQRILPGSHVYPFKKLCGEYPSAAAFAMHLACFIFRTGQLPRAMNGEEKSFSGEKHILLHNYSRDIHHSLILLSSC